jgi:hypothetical protein
MMHGQLDVMVAQFTGMLYGLRQYEKIDVTIW